MEGFPARNYNIKSLFTNYAASTGHAQSSKTSNVSHCAAVSLRECYINTLSIQNNVPKTVIGEVGSLGTSTSDTLQDIDVNWRLNTPQLKIVKL